MDCITIGQWKEKEKRMDVGFHFPVCHGRIAGFVLSTSNSRVIGHGGFFERPKFDLGCGFLSGFCKLKVTRFCKPKKKSFLDASVGWAGPLEQQAIGSEIRIEELDSEGSVLEKSESDCHLHFVE